MAAVLEYIGNIGTSGSNTSGSIDVGTVSGTALIILTVEHVRSTAPSRSVSSGTIGGSAAAIATQLGANAAAAEGAAILYREVAVGGSTAMAVTLSGAVTTCIMHVYKLTGYDATTPLDTVAASGNDPSGQLDLSAGGVAVGAAAGNGNNSISWTGLDTRDADAGATGRWSTASSSGTAAEVNHSVSVSSASADEAICVASWAAAASGLNASRVAELQNTAGRGGFS